MKSAHHLTIQDIVSTVQDHAQTDEEAVAVILHLFRTRRVQLSMPPPMVPEIVH